MGQVAVGETQWVWQLKRQLFDILIASADASIESPQHLRVKDFKGGKLSSPLRDDRQLCKCLMVRGLLLIEVY